MAVKTFAPLCCCLLLAACATPPAAQSASPSSAPLTAPQQAVPAQPITAPQIIQPAAPATLANHTPAQTTKRPSPQQLARYIEQAKSGNSAAAAQQAAQLALHSGDAKNAIAMAKLWLKRQPHDQQALQVLTLAYVLEGQMADATASIETQLKYYPQTALPELLAHARGLPATQFNQLLTSLATLAQRYPKQAPLWFVKAVTEQNRGRYQAAIDACNKALALRPKHLQTGLLKADLLVKQDKPDSALTLLASLQKAHPDQPQPAVARLHLLLQQNQLAAAGRAIKAFTRDFPNYHAMQLALALFALHKNNSAAAIDLLTDLQTTDFRPGEVSLYLGQAYVMHQDWKQAISIYMHIDGKARLEARVRATHLMYAHHQRRRADDLFELLRLRHPQQAADLFAAQISLKQHYQQRSAAKQLLTQALHAYPNNRDLLYLHAMTQQQQGNFKGAEKTLRATLAKHPNDIDLLNALGYSLSNHSKRYQEAWYYIKRAYARAPDNPAIKDSLGWVLYRLQRYQQALPLLQAAYRLAPGPEVAMHLVKTLAAMGQHQQAVSTLQQALKHSPHNAHLKALEKRLDKS